MKKCSKCGGDTNSKSGLCAPCTVDERVNNKPEAQGEKALRHNVCIMDGCRKWRVKDGLCLAHYKEKYGHSHKAQKRKKWGENMENTKSIEPVEAPWDYPDLYQYVEHRAKKEYRTMVMQVFAIIAEARGRDVSYKEAQMAENTPAN